MGVIENAIEKLRRAGVPGEAQVVPGAVTTPFPGAAPARLGGEPVSRRGRVVAIERPRLRGAGYLPELGCEQRFSDYYQSIKRPVIRRAAGAGTAALQRLVMVTSAMPGDGKTFTSINLALSMAREKDMSVVLVDGDFAKAQVGRVLAVQDEPGLLDALVNPTLDVESLVLRTDVPGLEVLPGGQAPAGDAAELVASAHATAVFDRLLTYNPRRLVLLDAAPLLATTDARALSQLVGQILLVTRSGHTPQQALVEAISLLDRNKLQGLVLNDAYSDNKNTYYGYHYRNRNEGTDNKND